MPGQFLAVTRLWRYGHVDGKKMPATKSLDQNTLKAAIFHCNEAEPSKLRVPRR